VTTHHLVLLHLTQRSKQNDNYASKQTFLDGCTVPVS